MSKKIAVTLEVTNDVEAQELKDAWQEIVTGRKLTHAATLEHSREVVMERARTALQVIEAAIRPGRRPGQDSGAVLGCPTGHDYAFDLIELRALDTKLANACLDYLNYDRLGKQEVHHHLPGGERELQRWIERYGIMTRRHQD